MPTVPGLDASFARIDLPTFQRFKGLGHGIFIQDLWTGGYANNEGIHKVAEANLRDARVAGFTIAAYSNANPWWPVTTSVIETKANAGAMWSELEVVAVDAEIEGLSEANILDLALAFENEGKRVCIYTAEWVWVAASRPAWTSLGHYPLWVCQTDKKPALETGRAFGPWALSDRWAAVCIIGKQYDTSSGLLGKEVDLNTFALEFFKEETMATVWNETQQRAILAMSCATAAHLGRGLDAFFDPLPADAWAAAWRFVGAPTAPAQPTLTVNQRRFLGVQVTLDAPMSG